MKCSVLLQRSICCLTSFPSHHLLPQTFSCVQQRVTRARLFSTTISKGKDSQPPSNIEVETQGYVKIIAINRPNKRNAVNQATAQELYDVFCDLEEDESVRIAVLCGRGGTFCAGYDLSELANAETIDSLLLPFGKGPAPMVINVFTYDLIN